MMAWNGEAGTASYPSRKAKASAGGDRQRATGKGRAGEGKAPQKNLRLSKKMMDRYTHFTAWYVSELRFRKQWLDFNRSEEKISVVLNDDELAYVKSALDAERAKKWLTALGLLHSLDYLELATVKLAASKLKLSDALAILTQLPDRIMSELKDSWQIHVPKEYIEPYRNPLGFWAIDFPSTFPTANADAVETVKCLGASRFTAAVFHSMRVLEVGIKALATKLGVAYDRQDKSWASVLTAIQEKIDDKFPAKGITQTNKARRRVYHQMVAHFNTFMKAWRDYTIHNPIRYKRETAISIISAVRAFMQAAVTDGLKEKPKLPKAKRLPKPATPLALPSGAHPSS